MKRIIPFLLLCFVLSTTALRAQSPEEKLALRSQVIPVEKAYLHFDRDNYLAGDAGYFKAYLMSGFVPDSVSSVLYVELLNKQEELLNRQVVPLFNSTAVGHVEFPDTLSTGDYLIRAYTPLMLNDSSGLVYKKQVFVYSAAPGVKTEIPKATETVKMGFYPEGGNMVAGFRNTIAFKAVDESGLPVNINGLVVDDRNDTLISFSSVHDGMGMFDIDVVAGRQYFAVTFNGTVVNKFPLPASVDKGIALSVIPHPEGYFFEIQQHQSDERFMASYMIGQMQQEKVFRQDFKLGAKTVQGVLNTKRLLSGILHITIFNKDGMPLAERLVFVDNGEYRQHSTLMLDTVSFKARAKNVYRITLKDTMQATISVSVTDAGFSLFREKPDNIISAFLLTDDLPGTVHHPLYYFSSGEDSVKTALDLLMMTQGWRRFKWTDLQAAAPPVKRYQDPAWIHLSGQVNIIGTRIPFASKPLIIFMAGADSSRSIQMLQTDLNGRFRIDSMIFYGNTRFLFSDIHGRKSKVIEVHMDKDSLFKSFYLPLADASWFTPSYKKYKGAAVLAMNDMDEILRAQGKMLTGVTVRAKKKSVIQELEDKYASGLFAGFSERTMDLTHVDAPITDLTIFDYLMYRVPGLQVQRDGIDYRIFYRQMANASSMGEIPMTLFLDEMQTDAQVISSIPPNDIAMVKIFNSFAGASGNGAGGVMAIYTKKGSDQYDASNTENQISYRGFSLHKEFYAPDYEKDPEALNRPDRRITLQWIPEILVNGADAVIPLQFYSNDAAKAFKLVVEGMTADGKLIYMEKNIFPAAK